MSANATSNMEKRRYVRYELLDYALLDLHGDDEQISVVVTDIGLGGLQVRTKSELECGLPCATR
ncbi:PilZ domain-containing protein, partial [bacterium]